ncbi:apolipoprotein C-I-like [Cebidichthys violaceus]|uniref:apolipoprotein C-I-like n=1 Tax=Cebidichthys violaceus TaxID=271503 RepID=UPI0035CC8336
MRHPPTTEWVYKEEHIQTLKHTLFFSSSETDTRVTAKMRLYLAVAVLMLAFVAYTEAQDQDQEQDLDPTFTTGFNNFGERMAEVAKNLAEKAKTTFEEIQNSKIATDSRDWFQTQIDKLKERINQ